MPGEIKKESELATPEITQAKSSLPSRFWLAADANCRGRIEKLPVFRHMAMGAQRYEIIKRIVAERLRLIL